MKTRAAVLAVAALALLGAGKARKNYMEEYEEATRELIKYSGFSTAIILRATYLDAEFRHHMASERQRALHPSEADHQAYVARMADDNATYHEVVFSADSGVPGTHKFGDDDDGWLLRLFADGTEEKLVTTYRVRRPNNLHRNLYPHINIWSELWIARFARTVDDPHEVVLQVTSGYGGGELRWEDLDQ